MTIEFWKMNGAANDFVIVDNLSGDVQLSADRIAHVCDRRRGVGADGFILIEAHAEADFFMNFYNADGGPAEMCGNGSRCSAAFAVNRIGLGEAVAGGKRVRFMTGSGAIEADVSPEGVTAQMMDAANMRVDIPLKVAQTDMIVHFMTVGTRHVVVPVDDATALSHNEIMHLGAEIRHDPAFDPVGANVNFVSIGDDGRVYLRTFEKGVEAETHGCGTGSVASAVLLAHKGRLQAPVSVVQHCGDVLDIGFELAETGATDVRMTGPATLNFEGKITV